ncbi:MAG: hypothetical protein JW950_09105 [Deltaproteobacteria bacterium]|nr:hypothetical protein [Deltaproteobacteria bacterium]
MIEKIKDLYQQYYDQIMMWYEGLNEVYKYGVIFLLIVACLLILAFWMLRRITR